MNELIKITPSIEPEIKRFEKKLKLIANKDDVFLKEYLSEFLFSNPKRLRPAFIYLFSKILDIKGEIVDKIALSAELIHSASLIHDDIIDESQTRRNLPTLYGKFGSKISVLEGDFLLSSALEVLIETNFEIIKIFSKNLKKTLLGELNQNSNLNKLQTIDDYVNKTMFKTTSLFLVGLESLFSLKTIDNNIKSDLYNFMENYSIAFQIKNDINNILKCNSSDIKCGNYTLPVIYFCLDKNIEEIDINVFEREKEIYIKKALKKVEEYKISSINYLKDIENSTFKKELIELSNYTLRS